MKTLTTEQIKQEANRLRNKADEIELFVSTLDKEHQCEKYNLETKVKELRRLQKEYESFL